MKAILPAAAIIAVAAFASPALASTVPSDKTVELKSGQTREITMPIAGLGQHFNVLVPCYGFAIHGSGVDLAGGDLPPVGYVFPEDASRPDGGIPGAVKLPDGTFAVPDSAAALTPEVIRLGTNCAGVGWNFYGPDGKPALDAYDNPAGTAAAASKRKRAADRRRAKRRVLGHSAVDGPVTVTLAGLANHADGTAQLVLRVRTGHLTGPTSVTLHARVLEQG